MKILFIYQELSTFIKRDIDILKSRHTVREFQFRGIRSIAELWKGIKWCDTSFSWFGKLHAFFAVLFSRMLKKKSVVVAGGDDAAKAVITDGPLGLCNHPVKKWFAYFIFHVTDLIIAVSMFTKKDLLSNPKADNNKISVIYHGFDPEVFKKDPDIGKDTKCIATVAHISHDSYNRKGLRLFAETARLLPDYRFVVIGKFKDETADALKNQAPSNVSFTGELYGRDLAGMLSKALVYVQASEWESFGCSLAEAMLCECVPVVSNRTSLPEVVGDYGFYLEDLRPEELARMIVKASQNKEISKLVRKRIIESFSLEARKKKILEALDSLYKAAL